MNIFLNISDTWKYPELFAEYCHILWNRYASVWWYIFRTENNPDKEFLNRNIDFERILS